MSLSITHILEGTVKAYLAAAPELAGVQIYTGDSADEMVLPRIIVSCDGAGPPADLPEGLGNFESTVRISVVTSADDETLATHKTRVGYAAGLMQDEAPLKAAFNPAEATLYAAFQQDQGEGREERAWVTVLSYTLYCVLPP